MKRSIPRGLPLVAMRGGGRVFVDSRNTPGFKHAGVLPGYELQMVFHRVT
jgi:hypothetical protein